jgi:hypothetical protein
MTRPLRIEFDGALFHVTSRGDRKEAIYDDGRDRATLDTRMAQPWLAADSLLTRFGRDRPEAILQYAKFVAQAVEGGSIWRDLNREIYLGDDDFVARIQGSGAATPLVTGVPESPKMSSYSTHRGIAL